MIVYCLITLLPAASDSPTTPFRSALPSTLVNVDVVELSCTRYSEPDWNARLLMTVRDEPAAPLPGCKIPPLLIHASVTTPAPASVPPALTFTAPAMAPLTVSVPSRTFQSIKPRPMRVQFELPTLLKVEKP